MPTIMDKLREQADRAVFEADKRRRIGNAQSAINVFRSQMQETISQIGVRALELYDAEQLSQSELIELCRQIVALREEIKVKEAEIEEIRRETFVVEPAPAALFGHICPKCKIKLKEEAEFCPRCGSKAEDIAPPPSPTARTCANCGATLSRGVAFYPQCGAKVEEVEEQVTPAAALVCPNCQTPLNEGAVFCPQCGARVTAEEPPPEP